MHSIHFGFQLKTLTPYCHCAQPLDKGGYIAGTLAPGGGVGAAAILLSLVFPNVNLMLFGAMSLAVAVGDFAIVLLLAPQREVLVVDHPTDPGWPPFQRNKEREATPPFFACGLIG